MAISTPPATIPPEQGPLWHTLSIEEALREQGVDAATGLSKEEAERRLKQFGPNKFAEAKRVPGYIAFLNQYKDPMQIVLLVAAVVSLIIQQWSTALILIILTLFNALLALRQEGKAEASVAALQKMLIVKSKVRRGGQIIELAAEQLVPGDIVVLEAGDRVPADGKIIRAAALEIDESALTGESAPVPKQIEPVDKADTPLGDRVYEAFLQNTPIAEHFIIQNGIILIKYWLEVSEEEQDRRFRARIDDGRKIWKLSPMDVESHKRWYDYSRARDAMFEVTDTEESPWYVINSNDKKRARLNCIAHLLSLIPYKELPVEEVKLGKRQSPNGYKEPEREYHMVPEVY